MPVLERAQEPFPLPPSPAKAASRSIFGELLRGLNEGSARGNGDG